MSEAIHIVYVEDDKAMIELVRIIIHRQLADEFPEIEIHTATRGNEGLALINEVIPHIVMLDISLPEISGWQIFEQLRLQPETADLPVMIVTTRAGSEDMEMASEADIAAYVTKPFRADQVTGEIRRILAHYYGL